MCYILVTLDYAIWSWLKMVLCIKCMVCLAIMSAIALLYFIQCFKYSVEFNCLTVSHGGGAHPLLMRNVYIFLNKIYFMWFDSLLL